MNALFISTSNIIREKLVVNNFLCKYFIKQLNPPILFPELLFPLRSIHLCQRLFYKIFVKFRNSNKMYLILFLLLKVSIKMKINHSFQIISLLKMILIVFNFYLRKIVLQEVCVGGGHF